VDDKSSSAFKHLHLFSQTARRATLETTDDVDDQGVFYYTCVVYNDILLCYKR